MLILFGRQSRTSLYDNSPAEKAIFAHWNAAAPRINCASDMKQPGAATNASATADKSFAQFFLMAHFGQISASIPLSAVRRRFTQRGDKLTNCKFSEFQQHSNCHSQADPSKCHIPLPREANLKHNITFARLPQIELREICAHMSDPRVAEHMPLLTFEWDEDATIKFVASKEAYWKRDGLGHWAILANNTYVGWGGFQKEGDEWDYGLVLKPDRFGLGPSISRKAISFAIADSRIPFVTFLLPPSRKNLGALERQGSQFVGEIEFEGTTFLKYRFETS